MPKGYARDVAAPPTAERETRRLPEATEDPEQSGWFQRLPPAMQDEYRAKWAAGEARDAKRQQFVKDTLHRSIAQGACVFLVTETLAAMPSVWHSLAALVVGAGVGALWNRIAAGRFQCMTTSIAPYVGLRFVFADASNAFVLILTCIYAVCGFLVLLALTSLVGFIRERRRSDDEDC
jgi:hypothetical protein